MQIICHGLKNEDFPVIFDDHKISLGRDAANGIVVPSESVSGCHAILSEEDNALFLQDNGSPNGTFLNHNRISSKQKLADGDVILIGDRLIHVLISPEQRVVLSFDPPEPMRTVPTTGAASGMEHTQVFSETSAVREPFSSGSEIGKYVIVKRLGKGGMGEVYLARHKSLGIFRALKVLSKAPGKENSVLFERFIREAKLALEIRHPNVVGVMDVETDPSTGFPYIVMEYVDGGSLRDTLRANKKLSEEQAVVIVEAIASALQTAEEHNIVHRDIKPDNIMFTKRGEIKLADLGIAKSRSSDNVTLTKTNVMIGTPAYLPPEQARNAKGVDARADIYSLGATFYEMLTGEPPYPGEDTIEILHKLLMSPVPDPRKINPEVSPASASIIMKMLAKSPKDRFQNAKELLDMMERTFPAHTTNESCEVIRNVLAGDCQNNEEFSSAISSTRIRIPMPSKRIVVFACMAIFICSVAGFILWLIFSLFLPSDHDKQESSGGGSPVTSLIGSILRPNTTVLYSMSVNEAYDPDKYADAQVAAEKIGNVFAGENFGSTGDDDDRTSENEE